MGLPKLRNLVVQNKINTHKINSYALALSFAISFILMRAPRGLVFRTGGQWGQIRHLSSADRGLLSGAGGGVGSLTDLAG